MRVQHCRRGLGEPSLSRGMCQPRSHPAGLPGARRRLSGVQHRGQRRGRARSAPRTAAALSLLARDPGLAALQCPSYPNPVTPDRPSWQSTSHPLLKITGMPTRMAGTDSIKFPLFGLSQVLQKATFYQEMGFFRGVATQKLLFQTGTSISPPFLHQLMPQKYPMGKRARMELLCPNPQFVCPSCSVGPFKAGKSLSDLLRFGSKPERNLPAAFVYS